MAAYTRAWVVPWDAGQIGIAYEQDDGIQGAKSLQHAADDLPELLPHLSATDRAKVQERLNNVIPINRPSH